MLKECAQHGYFRAEMCPVCGQPGKFLMNDRELDHLGRILTGILRHFPDRYQLAIDSRGWVSLPQIVRAVSQKHPAYHWLRTVHLVAIAETDPKGRYEVRDDQIRATYAHTLEVELDLPTENIPDQLYYPVTEAEAAIVLEVGLKPSDRRKVHLSKTALDAHSAGSVRTPSPVLLEVDARRARADGIVIMQAGKTVFLVDRVPAEYLRRIDFSPPAGAATAGSAD
ncbi:MAG: RNA 2'-phosphotransferase [Thermoplasmata archaeon]